MEDTFKEIRRTLSTFNPDHQVKGKGRAKDIFNEYGFGIKEYFKFLYVLLAVYVVASLLILPVILVYSGHDGLENGRNYFMSRYSIGNLGFVSSNCYNQFVVLKNSQTLRCATGTMQPILYAGIFPKGFIS